MPFVCGLLVLVREWSISFYRIAFRKKIYRSITELQDDLNSWVQSYNEEPHQGRWCFGKTPADLP